MGSEIVQTTTPDAIKFAVDHGLEKAVDLSVGPEDTMAAAKGVVQILDRVESGDLIVQPPIPQEELAEYNNSALAVLGAIEKSLAVVHSSRKQRRRMAELATRSMESRDPKKAPRFKGNGSDIKA